MDAIILGGAEYAFPGGRTYLDDQSLAIHVPEDGLRMYHPIRHIVAHRTMGDLPDVIKPGAGPRDANLAWKNVHYWAHNGKPGATHFVIDLDGSMIQTADPSEVMAYGSGKTNGGSLEFELTEQPGGVLYEAQYDTAVRLCELAVKVYAIDRQVISVYRHRPMRGLVDRWATWRGCVGHCDVDDNRGRWDPGDHMRVRLIANGWTPVDLEAQS
jgi:hypothetical protein